MLVRIETGDRSDRLENRGTDQPSLVEQLAGSLGSTRQPQFARAVEVLRSSFGATGIALGEWPGHGDPRLLATAGNLGTQMSDPALFRFFRAVYQGGERVRSTEAAWLREPAMHYAAGLRSPGSELFALVLRQPRADLARLESGSLGLLRLIDDLRAHTAARLGSPRGTLAVPLRFVRCAAPGMQEVYRLIEAMRFADLPVLVGGETGVGKEHLVRLLHDTSPRAAGPFVAVNCAAIPAEMLEAEMFGVGRGAATGVAARRGMFQLAAGGTLFLDEIGELPLAMQAKLLRAMEGGQVQPVGGRGAVVDVRIVAATNADLRARSLDGSFRADLYYRLAGCQIQVPPLRERGADVPTLIDHFLGRACLASDRSVPSVEPEALRALLGYDWPGNVRELEHEIRRLVHLCPAGSPIGVAMLSSSIRQVEPRASVPPAAAETAGSLLLRPRLDALTREMVCRALAESAGNQLAAARLLGMSRNGLAAMVRRLGVRSSFSA